MCPPVHVMPNTTRLFRAYNGAACITSIHAAATNTNQAAYTQVAIADTVADIQRNIRNCRTIPDIHIGCTDHTANTAAAPAWAIGIGSIVCRSLFAILIVPRPLVDDLIAGYRTVFKYAAVIIPASRQAHQAAHAVPVLTGRQIGYGVSSRGIHDNVSQLCTTGQAEKTNHLSCALNFHILNSISLSIIRGSKHSRIRTRLTG